jgi:hypothetical protein
VRLVDELLDAHTIASVVVERATRGVRTGAAGTRSVTDRAGP